MSTVELFEKMFGPLALPYAAKLGEVYDALMQAGDEFFDGLALMRAGARRYVGAVMVIRRTWREMGRHLVACRDCGELASKYDRPVFAEDGHAHRWR